MKQLSTWTTSRSLIHPFWCLLSWKSADLGSDQAGSPWGGFRGVVQVGRRPRDFPVLLHPFLHWLRYLSCYCWSCCCCCRCCCCCCCCCNSHSGPSLAQACYWAENSVVGSAASSEENLHPLMAGCHLGKKASNPGLSWVFWLGLLLSSHRVCPEAAYHASASPVGDLTLLVLVSGAPGRVEKTAIAGKIRSHIRILILLEISLLQ